MMQITRLVELSLFYKIKDTLSVRRTGETAKSVDFLSYTLKYNNISTTYSVVVKVDGVVRATGYSVDYINGIVKFGAPLISTNVVTVDYNFCPFNVYDEGQSETTEYFKYPAIAVYEHRAETAPYELGNTNTEKRKEFILEVWTDRGGERTDAVDSLVDMLEDNLVVIDYNHGFPYNTDGTINNGFNSSNIITVAVTDSINYIKGGSLDIGTKPMYFAEIHVDLKIFI